MVFGFEATVSSVVRDGIGSGVSAFLREATADLMLALFFALLLSSVASTHFVDVTGGFTLEVTVDMIVTSIVFCSGVVVTTFVVLSFSASVDFAEVVVDGPGVDIVGKVMKFGKDA